MKVAISAQSNDIDSLVDPRFGRARWFIIADSETGEWQAHDNTVNVDATGGAGVQAASTVAAQGVAGPDHRQRRPQRTQGAGGRETSPSTRSATASARATRWTRSGAVSSRRSKDRP